MIANKKKYPNKNKSELFVEMDANLSLIIDDTKYYDSSIRLQHLKKKKQTNTI